MFRTGSATNEHRYSRMTDRQDKEEIRVHSCSFVAKTCASFRSTLNRTGSATNEHRYSRMTDHQGQEAIRVHLWLKHARHFAQHSSRMCFKSRRRRFNRRCRDWKWFPYMDRALKRAARIIRSLRDRRECPHVKKFG